MVTAIADATIAPAKVERTDNAPVGAPVDNPSGQLSHASNPATLPPIPLSPGSGEDPQDFNRGNRIHIKDGSLFIDPYLTLNPRELDPKNELATIKKLELTFSITNPSFFESPERAAIALNLGQLVPVSLPAQRSKLLDEVKQFNQQVDSKADSAAARQAKDKREPFAAIVRDTVQNPAVDPAGLETLKNGLGIYMLIREKLTQQGYYNRLSDYVTRTSNSDQILGDLADNLGVTPKQVREAALKGGLDGVGKLLGISDKYIRDVKELTEYAATQDFGYNLVEHWYLGRQQNESLPLQEKITLGMRTRIGLKLSEYRARVRQHYDVPAPVKQEETRIADALNLVNPIQRKLLYALGYEICFTPEMTADDIAFHKGIYGLHRKAANDLRDIRGTYRIFFSGKGDVEGSMRTLVHEVAHNLWPDHFTNEQVKEVDRLAANDQDRFAKLDQLLQDPVQFARFNSLFKAYKAGNEKEKAAVLASADELFAPLGLKVDNLFPHLNDPYELRHLVAYAQDTLQVEGIRYNKSGYNSPQERFREVISRFAELKQVRLRGAPELLDFIAPGLNQIWDKHYIPHLEKVYAEVMKNDVAHVAPAQTPVKIPTAANSNGPRKSGDTMPPANDTATQAVAACAADNAPHSTVEKHSIAMNDRVLDAKTALSQMGVRCAI